MTLTSLIRTALYAYRFKKRPTMLCFKNLVSLATMQNAGATAINLTQAATLKNTYKDGYCTFPAAGGKVLRLQFAASQNISVFALLGVSSTADITNYDPDFISPSTLANKKLSQSLRARAHQSENYVAVYSAAQSASTFEVSLSATSQNVYAHQLWIGDGIRALPGINMQRVSLGGAEIIQPTSGAIFASQRPSWRKYSVTLPAVTDAQWGDDGGLLELESLGNGTEAFLMPGGVSSDSARVGSLAIHGAITNFSAQQIKRGIRAVTFDITECR